MKIGKLDIQVDKSKTPKQYSKVWMTRWQLFVMFWCSVYFIVDIIFYKATNINNVVVLLISSIIASIIPYFCKSFLETKEDKKIQLEKAKLQYNENLYVENEEEVG